MKPKADLAASVAARLLNRARESGDEHQSLLTNYCLERFLYRLGASDRRDRFVLKGAMLLRLWSDHPYRATGDLDLLRRGDGAPDAIRDDLRAIASTPVPPDGVTFDGDRVRLEPIRAEDEYAGTRATMPARSGTARLTLQIDMGLGDVVWPPAQACTYPTLLDFPAPDVLAYPREAVVAEKLEAMVLLGDRNSRIRTSSTSTISPATSSSTAPPSPRPYGLRSSVVARPSRRKTPSASRRCTGRIRRAPPRCAPSHGGHTSTFRRNLKRSCCGCSTRSSLRCSRTCDPTDALPATGAPEGHGDEADGRRARHALDRGRG